MKVQRISAIIERDMRKFLRSPALMMSSMIFPLMQLIVLGYAFGGKIKGIKIALVDEDRTAYSRDLRERFGAVVAGPQTMQVQNYNSVSYAIVDLRAGFVRAVVYIPVDYSRRVDQGNRPRIAFIEDNTDNFVTSEILTRMQDLVKDINQGLNPFQPGQRLTRAVAAPQSPRGLASRRTVSVHRVHQVFAFGLDCHVRLHRGHDRRGHHLHRRQIARPA